MYSLISFSSFLVPPASHRVSFSQFHPSLSHPLCLSFGGLFIGSVSGRRLCLSCVPSRMHPSNTRTHRQAQRWRRMERGKSEVQTKKEWYDKLKSGKTKSLKNTERERLLSYIIHYKHVSMSVSLLICHRDPMQLVDMCRRCRCSCLELFVYLEECACLCVCAWSSYNSPISILFHTHTQTLSAKVLGMWVNLLATGLPA